MNVPITSQKDDRKVQILTDQWIIDPKLGYLIYDNIQYNEDDVIAGWWIEANLGAKYWSNNVNVNYALQISEPRWL